MLFFAAITICSIILESIHHINSESVTVIDTATVISVQTTWGGCIFVGKARYPSSSRTTHEDNIL
jgi:hypothetical protein